MQTTFGGIQWRVSNWDGSRNSVVIRRYFVATSAGRVVERRVAAHRYLISAVKIGWWHRYKRAAWVTYDLGGNITGFGVKYRDTWAKSAASDSLSSWFSAFNRAKKEGLTHA